MKTKRWMMLVLIFTVASIGLYAYASALDGCGKIKNNDEDNKNCNACYTKEIITHEQICAGDLFVSECKGVKKEEREHYRLYSGGDCVGSTAAGFYVVLGGSIFGPYEEKPDSATEEHQGPKLPNVSGTYTHAEAGNCLCVQGDAQDPKEECIWRAKSCI